MGSELDAAAGSAFSAWLSSTWPEIGPSSDNGELGLSDWLDSPESEMSDSASTTVSTSWVSEISSWEGSPDTSLA